MFSPLFRHFKSIKIRTTIFRDFRFYKGAMVSRLSISEPSWLKSLVRCSLAKRQCGLICRCRSVAGKLLHTFGPATEKLLSPSRVLVHWTVRALASAEQILMRGTVLSISARNLAYGIFIPYRWSMGVSERRSNPRTRAQSAQIGTRNGSKTQDVTERRSREGGAL